MKEIIGDLSAEISFSELRDQDILTERLRRHHAVRIRRRGELIGVLLDANLWTSMLERLELLQIANERYEDEAVLTLLRARANAEFIPATDEAIDSVFSDFESIVRSRSEVE